MSTVTAASFPIQLAGKEFHMSPLTDRDIDELDTWLQAQMVEIARASLKDDMSEREREEILGAAMREASRMTWLSGDGARKMRTLRGVSRVLWQSLRRRHPELSHDEVKSMLMDPATIAYVNTVFRKINNVRESKKKQPARDSQKR